MIIEDYCSYEVAKLLKEKGFDEECGYFLPTHQMAIKWLREIYKLFIEISVSIDLNGNYHYSYSILDRECKYIRKGYTSFDWNYEDTCEAALKYSLENLI